MEFNSGFAMKYIGIVLVLLGVFSCNGSYERVSVYDFSSRVVDITGASGVKKNIDDYVDNVKLVCLETKDNSVVSEICEVVVSEQHIYIRDSYHGGGVAIFDCGGKFLRRLPSGNADSEIALAGSIFYDSTTDLLYVYDISASKILKYSSDGIFLSCHYMDDWASGVAVRGKNLFMAQTAMQNETATFEIIVADTSGEVSSVLSLGPQNIERESLRRYFHSYEDGIIVNKPWDNRIVRYCDGVWMQDLVEANDCSIDLSGFKSSFEMGLMLAQDQFVFKGVGCRSGNWWIYRMVGSSYARNLFRNEKNGDLWLASPLPHSFFNLISIFGVQDSDDRNIVAVIDPEYMISGSSNPDFCWDGSNPNNLISPDDMAKLKSVKEDDNPIIVLFKLKDEI